MSNLLLLPLYRAICGVKLNEDWTGLSLIFNLWGEGWAAL